MLIPSILYLYGLIGIVLGLSYSVSFNNTFIYGTLILFFNIVAKTGCYFIKKLLIRNEKKEDHIRCH